MAPKLKQSSKCELTCNASPEYVVKLLKSLEPARSATIIFPNHVELPSIHCAQKVQLSIKTLLSSQYPVALSIPRNDSHDSFLLRDGKLYCNLSSASFKTFGLNGIRSSEDRYFTVVDIHTPSKNRDRLEWAAENTMLETYDFVAFNDAGTSQGLAGPTLSKNIIPPKLRHPPIKDAEDLQDWTNYIIEYIGLSVICPQVLEPGNGGIDTAIFDYASLSSSQQPQEVQIGYLDSSLLSRDIQNLWQTLNSVDQPWAVLHVRGHDGSPIAFRSSSPHKLGSEYGYTIIKNTDGELTVIKHDPF